MTPRPLALVLGLCVAGLSSGAHAQGEAATVAELQRQVEEMRRQLSGFDAMRRRLEELEARVARQSARPPAVAAAPPPERAPRRAVQADAQAAQQAAREARASADEAAAIQRSLATAPAPLPPAGASYAERTVPGLRANELMGSPYEDALRSDLPGIAFRVPGTDTQVRLYGFAKISAYNDFGARNQTDAPLPGGIPLRGSDADRQGGDFGATARFSRFGIDTRTLTGWGTLETRIEGDFGGGAATSTNAVFRLRQAWAELGSDSFRVLAGQANSLWNEGLFETLIDATNLNQSFIRQAQLRVTGRLMPGLTGQLSIEAPETQYTSARGVFLPGSGLDGGASPSFNSMPDFLGRLTYRKDGLEVGMRGLLRQIQIRPDGTAAVAVAPPASVRATGWGFAAHGRFPMRWVSDWFGADELLGMAYYGEGIGRYFPGSTNGQDALSNIGLAGVQGSVSLNPIPAWGVTAAYRRFWLPQLRSNFSYAYSRQDFPSYALSFAPGSAAATSLNRGVHQIFANLIWSPFGTVRDGGFSASWLDLGLEFVHTRRDIYGGAAAAGTGQVGHGIANRILFATIARF
ncbi:DcaP family trimeric outer membrane transporter [Roseococcus sp. YIM B11640]|uniref:DcaP family trimeric outer membrane transporter n=1 Tax=Roseococcus sp. YIM B11640 TaxID=3133973 RepID=UPI003C7E2A52